MLPYQQYSATFLRGFHQVWCFCSIDARVYKYPEERDLKQLNPHLQLRNIIFFIESFPGEKKSRLRDPKKDNNLKRLAVLCGGYDKPR